MKKKVVLSFMIIIILTLGLAMTVFGISLSRFYYQGISNTFQNHADAINPLWEKEKDFQYGGLEDYSEMIIQTYQYSGAELQLLSVDGELIQSSSGFYENVTYSLDSDIFSYETYYEKEMIEGSGEKVLAVYVPLVVKGQVSGVLRYVSSVEQVDSTINRLLTYGILVSMGVAAIAFLASLRLANSIVKPVNKIIEFTREMSKERFEKRIEEDFPYELGEMAKTLNYMADEIEKTDRLKNEFISSISHELRTPLTGIKGWIETMKSPEGLTEEETQLGLGMIDSESERLIQLVEDLLDFSRYQSNRIPLHRDWFRFDGLIQEVGLQLREKAAQKEVQLKYKCRPALIYADRDKLRQVLLNLLDNAIKFSNNMGEIEITESIDNKIVFLRISDQGIGMNKEELAHIMDSFYQINSKSVGAGLGLAITRQIVELHGGTIEFKSEYGNGTTVEIHFPVEVKE